MRGWWLRWEKKVKCWIWGIREISRSSEITINDQSNPGEIATDSWWLTYQSAIFFQRNLSIHKNRKRINLRLNLETVTKRKAHKFRQIDKVRGKFIWACSQRDSYAIRLGNYDEVLGLHFAKIFSTCIVNFHLKFQITRLIG